MNVSSPQFLKRVEDAMFDYCVMVLESFTNSMMDKNDMAYGDEKLSDAEFALFYQDLAQRGVLEALQVVAPERALEYQRRFVRVMQGAING